MSKKDYRRIKSGAPMDAVGPFIMPTRSGSTNIFSTSVDIGNCELFLRKLRLDGMKGVGMIHIFMAAYVRVVSQLPGMNRFIRGQRVYTRKNMEICMTIKKELTLNAPETVIKLDATPSDTLYTIYENLNKLIEENKKEGDNNDMDSLARVLMAFPSVFLKFFVWNLKLWDYFGLLPKFLTRLSPFHGSLFITNLGSLGIPPVFHHLYEFGNMPLFLAMGAKRTEYVMNKDGQVEKKRYVDFTLTCDERICDGHYYATALKMFKKIIEKPEQLLTPPEKIVEDIK